MFFKIKNRGNITKITNPNTILGKVEGSWLECVEFNGKRYWDLEKIDPASLVKIQNPLASDCRFREDLIFLAKKDLTKAQELFITRINYY